MSDNQQPSDARPWHGADSPFEALFQWMQGELAKLRGEEPESKTEAVSADDKPDVADTSHEATPDPEASAEVLPTDATDTQEPTPEVSEDHQNHQ